MSSRFTLSFNLLPFVTSKELVTSHQARREDKHKHPNPKNLRACTSLILLEQLLNLLLWNEINPPVLCWPETLPGMGQVSSLAISLSSLPKTLDRCEYPGTQYFLDSLCRAPEFLTQHTISHFPSQHWVQKSSPDAIYFCKTLCCNVTNLVTWKANFPSLSVSLSLSLSLSLSHVFSTGDSTQGPMQGKCSTIWAMPQSFCFYFGFEAGFH
jgi:hypothetical protein